MTETGRDVVERTLEVVGLACGDAAKLAVYWEKEGSQGYAVNAANVAYRLAETFAALHSQASDEGES